MGASVVREQVRVDDAPAVDKLLKPVPDPHVIRSLIERGGRFFHQVWNRQINIDFWFSSNGTTMVCFAIGGLTVQQAASVRRWWHTISEGRADRTADQECLVDIVEAVTGERLPQPEV